MSIDIEADNIDIGNMVRAAKCGSWDEVFEVLDKKPNLISCIPQERSWGVLHQAVYWNRHDIINRLLKIPACDVLIKTKPCQLKDMPPSSTPKDIAQNKGYTTIENILAKEEINGRHQRFSHDVPYVLSRKAGEKKFDKLPLFLLEIAMYKHSLVEPHTDVKIHMTALMKKIFYNEENHWDKIQTQVHNSVYGFCRATAENLEWATTEAGYFKELIALYTANNVYAEVNKALARAFKEKEHRSPAADFALGLYALLLDIILTFWGDPEAVSQKTFRGVGIDVTSKYEEGKEIMFTTFASSSKKENVAEDFRGSSGTLFIINNSASSRFRPRNIVRYSKCQHEDECVYVVGSEFKVDHVDKKKRVVELRLI